MCLMIPAHVFCRIDKIVSLTSSNFKILTSSERKGPIKLGIYFVNPHFNAAKCFRISNYVAFLNKIRCNKRIDLCCLRTSYFEKINFYCCEYILWDKNILILDNALLICAEMSSAIIWFIYVEVFCKVRNIFERNVKIRKLKIEIDHLFSFSHSTFFQSGLASSNVT